MHNNFVETKTCHFIFTRPKIKFDIFIEIKKYFILIILIKMGHEISGLKAFQ
jgi:hypothetical protein